MDELVFKNRTSFYYFLSKFIYNIQQSSDTLDKLSSVWQILDQSSTHSENLSSEDLSKVEELIPEFLCFVKNGEI